METIRIYKYSKGLLKFLLYSGPIIVILGATILIHNISFKGKPIDSIWDLLLPVCLVVQGLFSFLQGYIYLRKEKLFIRWDDVEITYQLWNDKAIETIRIADITKVTFKLKEISVQLPGTEKSLCLEGIQYNDLQRLKKKFDVIISQIK